MKKTILILAAILMMAGYTNQIFAQSTVTGTTAGAKIIVPLTLSQTSVLHMGTMSVLASTPGTCILSTTNTRTTTGGVQLSTMAPLSTNAAYHVIGEPLYDYAIVLPATVIVIAGGGQTMSINTLKARPVSKAVDGLIGSLSGTGTDDFSVGGTLHVSAAQ
ncbi:MAG: DUF4402 domain-containing protein, partial [Bacteroidetes bacterium]|nr:DUF4402 domain-containing protein [Bacteroidota bacterium]